MGREGGREYRRLDELGAKLGGELGRVRERVLLASAVDLRIWLSGLRSPKEFLLFEITVPRLISLVPPW